MILPNDDPRPLERPSAVLKDVIHVRACSVTCEEVALLGRGPHGWTVQTEDYNRPPGTVALLVFVSHRDARALGAMDVA